MKTQEELNELKDEVKTLNKKLEELTEEELKQVTGGETWWVVEHKVPTENKEVPWYNTED